MTTRLLVVGVLGALAVGLSAPAIGATTGDLRSAAAQAGGDGKSEKAKKKPKKDAAASARPATATVSVNGSTYTVTSPDATCSLGRKIAAGGGTVILKVRSFEGTDGTVTITITVDPDNPRLSTAQVRSESGDPHWEGGNMSDPKVDGRTTSASFTFVSPIEDAKAVAARQNPPSFPGTASFTC